jgi:hypothetical protein
VDLSKGLGTNNASTEFGFQDVRNGYEDVIEMSIPGDSDSCSTSGLLGVLENRK